MKKIALFAAVAAGSLALAACGGEKKEEAVDAAAVATDAAADASDAAVTASDAAAVATDAAATATDAKM
jgi:hypothetical protein